MIEYLNIKSIIRGHQDSKMLQFLSYQTDSNEFNLNFFYGKGNSNSVANIAKLNSDNLYEIENNQPNINTEFRIKNDDIIVWTTSSAIVKRISRPSYLILKKDNDLSVILLKDIK